jgi:hypothetical protein
VELVVTDTILLPQSGTDRLTILLGGRAASARRYAIRMRSNPSFTVRIAVRGRQADGRKPILQTEYWVPGIPVRSNCRFNSLQLFPSDSQTVRLS